jgi:hypothetical protein
MKIIDMDRNVPFQRSLFPIRFAVFLLLENGEISNGKAFVFSASFVRDF